MSNSSLSAEAAKKPSPLTETFVAHTSAPRLDTHAVVTDVLRKTYPDLELTTTSKSSTDLLGFARSGRAKATPFDKDTRVSKWSVNGATRASFFSIFGDATRDDAPPPERKGDSPELIEELSYGSFLYEWQSHEFLLFVVEGIASGMCRPEVTNYLLSKKSDIREQECGQEAQKAHALIICVAEWMMQAGRSVLIFDDARWKKDSNLWKATQSADWDKGFFDSEDLYTSFAMPWKRGTIFHGPPGNGKTLVIQTLMKALSTRPEPIPTLYVKTFVAEMGPQWSVSQIFRRARATAPCLLVFEDIDSMVTEKLRSYFLNEVDGLESNNGIYMLGTTNHLDRLDPSLAQRPSRFDRKIQFEEPSKAERAMYARMWKKKLPNLGEREFPDELCEDIADETDGFSFAYLKELFVATLLGVAREGISLTGDASGQDGDIGIEKTTLRSKFMTQVDLLRAAIEGAEAQKKDGHEEE